MNAGAAGGVLRAPREDAMDHSAEQNIRQRAYELWEKEGSPHGRDQEFWERARLMVQAEKAPPVTTPLSQRSASEKAEDAELEGTFPASDPPSFTADTGARSTTARR